MLGHHLQEGVMDWRLLRHVGAIFWPRIMLHAVVEVVAMVVVDVFSGRARSSLLHTVILASMI